MTKLALPNAVAAPLQQQQARMAMAMQIKVEVAKAVFCELVPLEYQIALSKAAKDANPYGTGDDGELKPLAVVVDLNPVLGMALHAADMFLTAFGLPKPELPKPVAGGGG
jgi:hypothetical protein